MKIKLSLSTTPKYTEHQEEILWTLLHDKDHVIGPSMRNPDMELLLKKFSSVPEKALYRGIYRRELADIKAQMESVGYVALDKYLSFSELRSVADGFARASGTNTILEIFLNGSPSKRKAFCYHEHARNLIMAADLQKEFGGRIEDRDYIIELLDDEMEWIYRFQFKFKVTRTRTEGRFTILTIVAV